MMSSTAETLQVKPLADALNPFWPASNLKLQKASNVTPLAIHTNASLLNTLYPLSVR